MSFQKTVNANLAPGIAGDFASTNPRHNVLGGPLGLICGSAGVACGYFGWTDVATGTTVTNSGAGKPIGFVHNAHQALITTYLGEATLVVPGGFMMGDLFDSGDFWATNGASTVAVPGQKVFVDNTTGKIAALAAAGTVQIGGNISGNITAASGNFTATIAPNLNNAGPGTGPSVMNVAAVTDGLLYPGATLSGSGVTSGSIVINQLNGNIGGVGNYTVTPNQTVANTTIEATYGNLTVSAVNSGAVTVGQTLQGSGITVGSQISAKINTNSYVINPSQAVANITAGNVSGATESDWYVANGSFGAPTEVIKITVRYP
jgi:hypothetical protein